MTNEEREALIEQGWTPPVAVDPEVGSIWKHYNGGVYEVIAIANTLDTEKYPKAVIHKGVNNGLVWTRRADDWHRSYTQQAKTSETPVDPDIAEAEKIRGAWPNEIVDDDVTDVALAGIKRGRELERAVMGNPIPEQIQEVKPTVAVDPDIAEAWDLVGWRGWSDNHEVVLSAIKRGRALAAEAKPGMVWKKWDGSEQCPVKLDDYVWSKGADGGVSINRAGDLDWMYVTHYAIITPPEDAA